jgi:Flp pilus assembly protein TadG
MEANSMKTISVSFLRKVFTDQRGQVIVWMAFAMTALIAMGGFTVDVGHAYLVRNQLQKAANSAALASVPDLYTTVNTPSAASTTLINDAMQYSGATNTDANYSKTLGTVSVSVTTPCLNSLMPGTTCSAVGNVPNAVVVRETAQVPTFFMSIFGVKKLNVAATATASPGGSTQPWNLAIILDATPSMIQKDPNCTANSAEQCALNGVMQLLTLVSPCLGGAASCTASSNMASVRVSLFAFPNVSSTTVSADYCGGGSPTGEPYTLPPIPPAFNEVAKDPSLAGYTPIQYKGSYSPRSTTKKWTGTYQITPPSATPTTTDPDANGFSSDFYPGTTTEQLNPNSVLVKAVGNAARTGSSTTNGCMTEPGTSYAPSSGVTYFASAIYAAQAALQAEKAQADALLPSGMPSTNAIIFVSDGQANTPKTQFPYYDYSTAVITSGGLLTMDTSTGAYPSTIDPCQQAMIAGQWAAKQGTKVFGVAYGSESTGCADTSIVSTTDAFNIPFSSVSKVVPCVTIENIADSMKDFYAESSSVGCSVSGTNQPMNSLATIFEAILSSLGNGPRLIPNGIS